MLINCKIDINITVQAHNGIIYSNEDRKDYHYMEEHDYVL